jgi:hypothetical protein
MDSTSGDVSLIGEYASFSEAKLVVDKTDTSGVLCFVHDESNRVLYRKGE